MDESHTINFDLSRTIRRAFAAAAPHLPLFAVVAIVGAFPSAALDWVTPRTASLFTATFGHPSSSGLLPFLLIYMLTGVMAQVFWGWSVGWMCRVLVQKMSGQPYAPIEAFRYCVGLAVPLALLALAQAIGFIVGCFLLIVPGVIFALATWVAVPVLVSERLRPFDAIRRSIQITRGSRASLFGLFAIALHPNPTRCGVRTSGTLRHDQVCIPPRSRRAADAPLGRC